MPKTFFYINMVYFIIIKWNIELLFIFELVQYTFYQCFFRGGEHNWLFFFSSAIFASKIWLVYSKNLDIYCISYSILLLSFPVLLSQAHIWLHFVHVQCKYSLRMCVTFFIYQSTNDAINLRPISERISTFPKITILSVQIQWFIAWLFSIY